MTGTYLQIKTTTAIQQAMREIRADIAAGRVPASVESFSDLHDYVDANEYGGLCDDTAAKSLMSEDEWLQWAQDTQASLDSWIKDGHHRQPRFTWTGWFTGDECDPPEPGKTWLAIEDEGEEYAIIVLRTGHFDRQEDITAAEAAREIRARNIVRALNELDERGDYAG